MSSVAIIYHRADYDGLFSGAVAALAHSQKSYSLIGWDYGDYVPALPADCSEIVMLDICIPEFMEDPRLTWIDHHKSSITKHGSHKGVQQVGTSACVLAWRYYFPNRPLPEVLRLVGKYDVWDLCEDSVNLQYGLTAGGISSTLQAFELLKTDAESPEQGAVSDLIELGEGAKKWHNAFVAKNEESAYIVDFEGLTFQSICSAHARGSQWIPLRESVSALMAVRVTGDNMVDVSLYHAPGSQSIDLSKIAVKHGGGGHPGACGFRIDKVAALQLGLLGSWSKIGEAMVGVAVKTRCV